MTECQRCSAKSQLFLCQEHVGELAEMFSDLPRLTQHLAEAATGQTRLGERSRRTSSDEAPMRVNLKASELLTNVNEMLIRRTFHLRHTTGINYKSVRVLPPGWKGHVGYGDVISKYSGTTAKLAFFLALHVNDIAADEQAGDCFNEVYANIKRILSIINRPIPPRFCGPCPSPHPDDGGRQCGMALMARRDAVDVRCPQCGNTHNVEVILRNLLVNVEHWRFTVKEILMIMETLGDRLPERTFQRWRKTGVVSPTGWRRPDGRVVVSQRNCEGNAEPMFRLSDVRRAKARFNNSTRKAESA